MVLNDRPTEPVDAALFFGRSWFDAEKTGVYQLMKDFYDQGMIKYIVLYGGDGQKFGETVPDVAAPGKRFARDRLVKMGVPNESILDSELEDQTENNTLEEGRGMLNLVRSRGWSRVVAVANEHQLLRATLGLIPMINNSEGEQIDLWTAAPHDTNWNKRVRGAQGEHFGPRSDHIILENNRVRQYQEKGDLASFERYHAYIQNRDQRIGIR
ncbi:MAG: hypothetical protein HYV37_02475 [Candidatus Levyibacteriota bacterium]|nr:MAG: hypothetical protein HYV37_02475 [Candidatus Levybacteria bacterium]